MDEVFLGFKLSTEQAMLKADFDSEPGFFFSVDKNVNFSALANPSKPDSSG